MVTQIQGIEKRRFSSAVSPQFLLRVGGLPINVVDDLRFEKTAHAIEGILMLERLLAERKDRLVEVLHEAVGTHKEDQKLRRKIIGLKRDVFNIRRLNSTDREAARLLAGSLSSCERAPLEEWLDLWDRYQENVALVSDVFLDELRQKRALLKEVIDIPDFRKGILLSSPILDATIDGYIASDNLLLNREARTVERSLMEYLLRTACKTSPFSTLTSVCAGIFDDLEADHDEDILYQIKGMEKRSFTRINMAILSKLSSLLLACEEIRKELPVQVTPGWRIEKNGNRVRYLRRRQNMDDMDGDTPMELYMLHENVFYLPLGQLLQDLLERVGDGREAKLGDLISQLCNSVEPRRSEKEVEEYLQHLLRLGFLIVPNLQLDIHSNTPLAAYRKGLLSIETSLTGKLANCLGQVELLVDAYATALLPARRELLKEIKQQIKQCYSELGQPEIPIARTLVYEDTTLNPQKLVINQGSWGHVLSDAAELQHLLPIFDVNLQRKLVTRGYFRARYGKGNQCDDFLSFADEFHREFFEHFLQGSRSENIFDNEGKFTRHENALKLPEIEMLDDARQAVADYVRMASLRMPPGSKELLLGDEFFAAIAPYVPKNCGDVQSHTFFSQFARVDNQPLLIVNRIYTGLTLMFSRFAHFFAQEEGYQLVPGLRATLEKLQPQEAVFAELKGGYEMTNLNLHPQLTPYELVCPGDLSTRPKDEQIPLEDLFILDDDQGDCLRLYSKRLGKEIIPLYLGFLLPMALPEIQQVLLNFSYTPMCPLSLWLGAEEPDAGTEHTIAAYPRIRYKNIVLHRAFWKMEPQVLPQRASGQSNADFYMNVCRWQKENAVPSKVFVAPDTSAIAPSQGGQATAGPDIKSYKPLYVDFDNYFSVSLLEATLRATTNRLVMTEMLPDRDQLWFEHDEHSYVSEFVFEMNRIKEGSLA
ncbi:MAG: lantibiotic dehydratase [Ktedonobacteraceae bacterium]